MTDLSRIVWTDEKRFSLDGPNGYARMWWEEGGEMDQSHVKVDRFGERGVMVHLAFSCSGLLAVNRIVGTLDGDGYRRLLHEDVLPGVGAVHGRKFILQHDNAPPHTSETVRLYLEHRNVEVLDWPPYSPDLNPVETMWSIISRRLYEGGAQYNSETALWNGIKGIAKNVTDDLWKKMVNSVPGRLATLIVRNCGYCQ